MKSKMINYSSERLLKIISLSLPQKAFESAKVVTVVGDGKTHILKSEFRDKSLIKRAEVVIINSRNINCEYQGLSDKIALFRESALSPRGAEALKVLDERGVKDCEET